MKQLVLILAILFPASFFAQGLPCAPEDGCRCLLEKADNILIAEKPNYQQALYLYFAAQACDESLASESEEKILALFEKIESLRLTAESRAQLIQQQQRQLIAEKEAAELATRKAKAQNLNNLASKAILEEDMIEAFRLMQYANAYDPDNLQWLDNCQELFVRNTVGYSNDKYLNLLPALIQNPVDNIAGLIENDGKIISWGDDGSLAAWNTQGILYWKINYAQPIIGAKFLEDESSFISWDSLGLIRIHNKDGSTKNEFDHGSKPADVFLLEENKGFLSWSNKGMSTWDPSGQLTYSSKDKKPTFVIKKEIGDGFICAFKDDTIEFWNTVGVLEHAIKIPRIFDDIGLYEYNDSLFLTLSARQLKLWNMQGVAIDSNYHNEGFIGAIPIQDSRRALLLGRNKMLETNLKTYWIGGNPIEAKLSLDYANFLVWMEGGKIQKFDWEGNVMFSFKHPTNIVYAKFIKHGKELIYGTADGFVFHLDYDEGELISKFTLQEPLIETIFDAKESKIICITKSGAISFWPYNSRESKKRDFDKNIDFLHPVTNQKILIRYHNQAPHIENLSGEVLTKFVAQQDIWDTYIINEDLDILGSSSDSIYIWDISGALLTSFKFEGWYAFYQNEKSLLYSYSNSDGKIRMYNFDGLKVDSFFIDPHASLSGIAEFQNKLAYITSRNQINIYNIADKIKEDSIESNIKIGNLTYLKAKGYFFCHTKAGDISIWDLNGNFVLQKKAHAGIETLVFHPNNEAFFYADNKGGLFKSDFRGNSTLLVQLNNIITHVEFMPDNKSFITTDKLGNIQCWDQYGVQFGGLYIEYANPGISYMPQERAYINRTKYNYFIWSTSPTDILKTGNNIGIPDFTNKEKLKYGIDLDVAVDREYLPYPWLRE